MTATPSYMNATLQGMDQTARDIAHDFDLALNFQDSEAAHYAAKIAVIMGLEIQVDDCLNAVRVRHFKTHCRFVRARGEADGGRRGLRG